MRNKTLAVFVTLVAVVGLAFGATMSRLNIINSVINSTTIGATTPSSVNATTFKLNGAAPLNHQLCGNGTSYVDTSGSCGGSGASVSRTCGINGCYTEGSDGTFNEWGALTCNFSSSTLITCGLTYPVSFPSSAVLTATLATQPDGNDDSVSVYHKNDTLGGTTFVIRCPVNVGGSGCPNSSSSFTIHWQAVGY